ncbi:sensor histidine kinase [Roseomonas sp. KE2513]|uniref:sensor histidine kinase n=1 Tax=Roseomonas sp. KE2513 TaxID=2479202 RepID=UPI0018E011CA|nr:PAS domain S-box protein [Roseomonas sp. KE2513]
MARRVRMHDWGATSLGVVESWPAELRTTAALVLETTQPAVLTWGPDLTILYNDALVPLLAGEADALGRSLATIRGELWDQLGPIVRHVYASEVPCSAVHPISVSPVRRADGRTAGVFVIVPAALPAKAALREVADNVPALIGYHDRDLRYAWVNEGFARFFGVAREEIIGRTVPQLVGERAFARLRPWMERALAGEAVHFEDLEPDRFGTGKAGWTEEHYVPRRGPGDVVEGFYVLALDVTERKRAEAALRESEEQLTAVFESASVGLSEVSREGRFLRVNEELCRLLGRTREELLQLGVPDVTHPEDLAPSLQAVARSLEADAAATLDKRYHRPDGTLVWAQSSINRLRCGHGTPDRLLVVTADLTARREAEAALRESEAGLREREGQLRVVLAELQHRTRNLLGVVRAIASRTLADCEAFKEFEARLAAIGRVQGFLAQSGSWSASLHDVIKAELQAAGDGNGRASLDGPAVGLPGEKVQPVALALHELATNALKHGALSRPEGRLSITWRLQGEGEGRRLLLDWIETGVPMPDGGTPSYQGFGRQLIEQALPYQLKAETQLMFGTDGVCCHIALPLAERQETSRDAAKLWT